MLKSTSTDFGSLSSRRTATCNFLTAFPIDYLELGGHGMLHFQIQGALVFRQLNHTGCCAHQGFELQGKGGLISALEGNESTKRHH